MSVLSIPELSARHFEVLEMVIERGGKNVHKMPVEFQQRVDELDHLKVLAMENGTWKMTAVGARIRRRNRR